MNYNCILLLFIWLLASIEADDSYNDKLKVTKSSKIGMPREVKYFDDSSTIMTLSDKKVLISFNDGLDFNEIKEIKEPVIFFEIDPFFKERGFIITDSKFQYFTQDQGKSWKKFKVDIYDQDNERLTSIPKIQFNSKDKNLLMISNYQCPKGSHNLNPKCTHKYFYTKNGFSSDPTELGVEKAHVCSFARSTKASTIGDPSTIYCATNNLNSYGHIVESKLYKSEDFFKTRREIKPDESSNIIIDVKVEEDFLIVVSRMDKFNEKSNVVVFVSRDSETFNRADLNIDVKYGVMSFLPSSVSSLFVQIMDFAAPTVRTSTLYSTDAEGLHYKKILGDIVSGNVQKVENIDGSWIANVAVEGDNNDEDDKSFLDFLFGGGFSKDVITKISINDGKDWELLKVNDDSCKVEDGCSLHLFSNSELNSDGKFVTGPTPGILVGIGNKGKKLNRNISKLNTFVSRDGGISWTKAIDKPCIFSFGDQGNIILCIPYHGVKDYDPTKFVYYSLDQGKSWNKYELDEAVYPINIMTTVDGTSKKFVIDGFNNNNNPDISNQNDIIYTIDFSKVFDKTCKDSDFEEVYARKPNGEDQPMCVYGHKEKFKRRKQEAKCFVNKLFEDIKVYDEKCQCVERDFECSFGFKLSDKGGDTCVPDPRQIVKLCQNADSELDLFDKVLVNGNKCDLGKKKESDFITKHKIKCKDYLSGSDKGDNHQLLVHVTEFEGTLSQYVYVDQSKEFNSGDNIVLKTTDNQAYVSNNGGVDFVRIPIHDKIVGFYTGPNAGQIILLTNSNIIYVSSDGGSTFTKRKAPTAIDSTVEKVIVFHNDFLEKFIWFGDDSSAYVTNDFGESFEKLTGNVKTCDFVGAVFRKKSENLIYCSKFENDKLGLFELNDGSSKKVFDHIVGYAMTGVYVVVATVKDNSLEAKVTIDGETFADAKFPHDLEVIAQKEAYTILDSSTDSIFMHVTTETKPNSEYGTLIKSNSNGTYFVTSLENVNRNNLGFVDFDRLDGLEGSIIANVVKNPKETSGKKLQTLISHNDGSEWDLISPPAKDSNGKSYDCSGKPLEKCALHLHGFTERADYRDTYSSGSATGYLIGIGNVGEYLEDKSSDKTATFFSDDGGIIWKEIKKGRFMWEYGDRGTILILVNAAEATDTLLYSLNDGKDWKEYKFSDEKVKILDLATVPTDTSRKFMILTTNPKDSSTTFGYSIDFTNIYQRQCQLDLDSPDKDDFEYWIPKHQRATDTCLFGHESKFLRRASGHNDCFIGSAPLKQGFKVSKNCSCTRSDYECDFNYVRDPLDNTCKLVKGLTSKDNQKEMCSLPGAFEYFESTGYRKIPLSTCENGKQFDNWNPKPCPGKKSEFDRHYNREVSGGKLLFLIGVPLLIFISVTYFVYDRGIRRNGGFVKLGSIRLDDDEDEFNPIENNQVDMVVNKIVKGGIYTAAFVVATVKTLRKLDRSLLEKLGSVIFKRAPGRRNYVNVPDFEDEEEELFGGFQDNVDEELESGRRSMSHENPFRDEVEQDVFGNDDEARNDQIESNDNEEVNERLFDIDDEEDDNDLSSQPKK